VGKASDALERHPAFHPPFDRGLLVAGQVVAESIAHEDQELSQILLWLGRFALETGMAREPPQLFGDALRRQAEIHVAATERAPGHAIVARRRRLLDEGGAAGGLDRLQAERAI